MTVVAAPFELPPPTAETITFHFERQGLPVPVFTLTVQPDGHAIYQASYRPEIPKYSPYAATLAAQPNLEMKTDIMLTPATTARLFDQVHSTHGFANGCASKAKNIASTGTKILSAGSASCTYDYTEDKTIAALTNTFEAIAYTLDEGRKLENEHRYDRLALDPETEYLVKAVHDGSAVEVNLIAPTLHSLIDDPAVLERVRNRAASLLSQAGIAQ